MFIIFFGLLFIVYLTQSLIIISYAFGKRNRGNAEIFNKNHENSF